MQYDTVLYISTEINKSRWSCHRKSKQKPLGNNYAHFMKIALAWRPMKDNSVTRCPRSSRICRRGSTSGYHVFGNPTHFNELTERLIYLIQTQTQSSCILIYWVEVACSQILCYGALRMPSQGLHKAFSRFQQLTGLLPRIFELLQNHVSPQGWQRHTLRTFRLAFNQSVQVQKTKQENNPLRAIHTSYPEIAQ